MPSLNQSKFNQTPGIHKFTGSENSHARQHPQTVSSFGFTQLAARARLPRQGRVLWSTIETGRESLRER
jgi:hypothetical protein